MNKIVLLAYLLCTIYPISVFGDSGHNKTTTNQETTTALINDQRVDQEVIKRFINYLSTLDSFLLEFEQHTKKTKASGTLLIQRPERMRCNYNEPYPLLITSNKNQTSVYDYEMDQLSSANPQDTPFYFLLSKNVSLDKNFEIIHALAGPNGDLISLRHKDTETVVHILISNKTHHLERLIIVQPGSEEVDVQFRQVVPIKWFNNKLFMIRNPKIFGAPERLSSDALKNFYKK